ncbi:MAG: tungsten cofactor oxidoreductase radical SAM maturase [Firmicutes bacterium HGW-Firmicutes-2]|nr:MAG: tungsten cofactor oxidoreductase radical SAM maturase [Firmicutes bacterium HGW-Firmicutes-2]
MAIKKVNLELTDRCNLNCTMCYRKSWSEAPQDMTTEVLDKILNELVGMETLEEVVVGGIGEPTVHPRIKEVLERLSRYRLMLTSNGTSFTEDLMTSLIDHVDQLVISIDGLSEVFFDIRGFELQVVIDNVKKLNALKIARNSKTPQLVFQMVISKTNKQDVFKLMDLVSELGATQFIVSNILPASLEDKDLILYSENDVPEMKAFYQRIRNHGLKKGLEVRLSESKLKTERRCRFVENDTTVINAKGDVTPCYRFAHSGTEVVFGRSKKIEAHSFGHVMADTLENIWETDAYKKYRAMVYDNHYPSCTDCDLVDGCDLVRDTTSDCYGNMPSCGDCLWVRNLVYCI